MEYTSQGYRGSVHMTKRDTKFGSIYTIRNWKNAIVSYLPDGRIRVGGTKHYNDPTAAGWASNYITSLMTRFTPYYFEKVRDAAYLVKDKKYYRVGKRGLTISATGHPLTPQQEFKSTINKERSKAARTKYKHIVTILENICGAANPREAYDIYQKKQVDFGYQSSAAARKVFIQDALEGNEDNILHIVGSCVIAAFQAEELHRGRYTWNNGTRAGTYEFDPPKLIRAAYLDFKKARSKLHQIMYESMDVYDITPQPIGSAPQGRSFAMPFVLPVPKKKGKKK